MRKWFTLRRIMAMAIVICLIPAFLGLLYRAEFMHPVSTKMIWRWMTLQKVDRQWVELDQIAERMRFSVIMSEDGQFCSHDGVDWAELKAVVDNALGGEKARGASTITMQTVKNLFLWNGRSYVRKAIELPFALYLDVIWPKRRIMEVYLNIAEWDEGVFGIEAAAQHYFGRSAAKLTARQSALLTVTLPNPVGRNPAKPGPTLSRLANRIQNRAAKSGGYVGCVRQVE